MNWFPSQHQKYAKLFHSANLKKFESMTSHNFRLSRYFNVDKINPTFWHYTTKEREKNVIFLLFYHIEIWTVLHFNAFHTKRVFSEKKTNCTKKWSFVLRISADTPNLVTFTEEILNGKLHFLSSDVIRPWLLNSISEGRIYTPMYSKGWNNIAYSIILTISKRH